MGSSVKLTLIANFKGAAREMTQALKSVDSHVQKLTIDLKKVDAKAFNAFVTKTKLLGSAVRATRGPLQGAIAQQRALGREIEKNIRHGMDPASKRLGILKRRYVAVSMAVARLTQQKRDLAAKTKELTRRTKEEARAVKQALDSAANYARYGLMAVVAAGGLLAYSMLKASSGIENAEAAFRPMLGSLMKANALVGLINETAAKTPFQFEAISTSVKQLLPAVKGNMLSVIKTFRMLGDVSSGNAQRLDSVTRAYTKSMLRGQVDMRSLNMIARAGVPIFTELSKTMGVTVKELFKLSRAGEISSTDLTAAFERMTAKGGMFFEGMKIASLTLSGRISTLKDNIMLLGVNLGNVLLPAAKAFVEVSLDIVDYLREITKDSMVARIAVDALAASFLLAAGSLTYIILVAKGAVIINTLTLAFKGLAVAMWANPFGVVVAGLAAITVAIGLVIRNWMLLSVYAELAFDRIVTATAILQVKLLAGFATGAVKIGEAFHAGLIKPISGTFSAISKMAKKALSVMAFFRVAGAKEGEAFLKDFNMAISLYSVVGGSTAAVEIAKLAKFQTEAISALEKKSKASQDRIIRRLKDAKLVLEGVAGGGIIEGQERAPLADRLMGAGDKAAQREYNALQAVQAGLKERMKIYQIAKDRRIKFLRDEQARIRGLISIDEKERNLAVQAAEDLITKIREEGSKKRIKLAKKSNDDMFKELLRGTVNDTQARRHKMERETFKAHLEERMKIMQVSKADEAAFLEREYERLNRASGLSADQRVRAEEVASKMIIAIHKSTYKEMTKIIDDVTSANDKKLMERLQRNTDKLNAVKDKTITATINMSERTAAIMGAFVNHTTSMVANAAKTGKFAMKDMVQSIAEDIFKLMANKIISNFFMGIFGRQELKQNDMMGIMGQLGGGLLGGMFGGGHMANVPENALGSIATRRTLGIYGEAGPEAVMPLVRRNGVLGVSAPQGGGGGGGGGTTVNIINNAGVEIEEEHSRNAFGGEEIKLIIRKAVRDDMNSGKFDSTFRGIGLPPRRGTSRG